MPLFARSYGELVADCIGDLASYTNLTRLSAGGKARAIIETVSRRLEEGYSTFDLGLARAFVSSASGQYLDLIGELLGVDREKSQAASVSADMQVQKFYVESGTFGDINSSNDILIPAGTIVSAGPQNTGIVYKLINSLLLSASDSDAYASIEAALLGGDSNVGTGTLTFHNFINYTDNANNSLLTTNLHPIVNGKDFESDANYRFRIVNKALESEAANSTAIRLAGLSVAGVADIIIKRRYRGIGTFSVLIQSTTPTVSDALVAAVRARVEDAMALGEVAYVMGPKEVGLTMKLTIYYARKLSTEEIEVIESDLEDTITTHINSLNIGDLFSVNRLASELFAVSRDIANIGEVGKPLNEVYLYRNSELEDNRVREKLLTDYETAEDERVIIEPSVSSPIVFERQYSTTGLVRE